MSRRLGLLAVALVVALLGTSAVFSYVSKVEAKTLTGAEPVDVLVASERLASGTSGAAVGEGQARPARAHAAQVGPEGALTRSTRSPQTLVSDVFAGEVLLRAKFADQTARTGNLRHPQGQDRPRGRARGPAARRRLRRPRFGGRHLPHRRERRRHRRASDGGTASGRRHRSPGCCSLARRSSRSGPSTLRPADRRRQQPDDDVVAKAILTVAVTQAEAERLVHAHAERPLYFGLLSSTSKTAPDPGVTNSNLFQ